MNPLQDKLVCLVMTCNRSPYNERREAHQDTFDSIQKLNLKVLYEKEIRLTWDNSVTPEPELSKTW